MYITVGKLCQRVTSAKLQTISRLEPHSWRNLPIFATTVIGYFCFFFQIFFFDFGLLWAYSGKAPTPPLTTL